MSFSSWSFIGLLVWSIKSLESCFKFVNDTDGSVDESLLKLRYFFGYETRAVLPKQFQKSRSFKTDLNFLVCCGRENPIF